MRWLFAIVELYGFLGARQEWRCVYEGMAELVELLYAVTG